MFEWFLDSFSNGHRFPLEILVCRLVLAFVLGSAVAGIYWLTGGRDETSGANLVPTLVLLAILIAMVTQVIGESLARAFSLVGALSIVRFRTLVANTRDTAFVIFAVVAGMAAGVDYAQLALVGLCVTGLAAVIFRRRSGRANGTDAYWTLSVRIGAGKVPEEALAAAFHKHLEEPCLLSTSTSRQGATLDLTYKTRLRPTSVPVTVVAELNRLEDVQQVDLERL